MLTPRAFPYMLPTLHSQYSDQAAGWKIPIRIPSRTKHLSSLKPSRPALKLLIQRGAVSGVKRPRPDVNHWPPPCAEVKNEWSFFLLFSSSSSSSFSSSSSSFICCHYSPLWALACRTLPLHLSLSITTSLHLLTPITWISLSTSFVLLASCSSTSGKHSVPCLIGVLSRLKRFPFCFSWVNFAVLGTVY